jgi:hypothetical protein
MSLHIIDNFISEDLLNEGISIFNNAESWNYYEGSFSAKKIVISKDPDSKNKKCDIKAEEYLKKISDMAILKHKDLNQDENVLYTDGANLVNWRDFPNTKLGTNVHIDSHLGFEHLVYSTVIYLNDEYFGGEIEFPDLNIIHKPKSKQGVFFKSNMRHRVLPYSNGDRKNIVMWHTYDASKSWF